MKLLFPEVKRIRDGKSNTKPFASLVLLKNADFIPDADQLLKERLWNYPELKDSVPAFPLELRQLEEETIAELDSYEKKMIRKQGFRLVISGESAVIECAGNEGFQNCISTLKQLLESNESGYMLPQCEIIDWPEIEHRSISTTFAWYAGYGRYGFDMQLWGLDQWKQFLNICADYKINQLNMCMYGYWPFPMEKYPETVLSGLNMRIWNQESRNWINVDYKHPNLANEFLPELIRYGHSLGISFFAYIGLNSYSGGYSNAHKEKRMKMPKGNPYINDFDSLCLSDPSTIEYLKYCMKRVVDQGFDGIDFEESEEAFWYCDCPDCKKTFWHGAETPEQALHHANAYLLDILYRELKSLKSDIVIGLRAWRQPPLVRDDELIKSMVASIPSDVVLFWAPGQYVEDSEFDKWIKAFGPERIRGRDTEAIGFAAGLGRLVRPFRFNGLRTEEESITQFVEEDIRQHRGSAKRRVAGINGYQFEWYGFFMAFLAHAYYGWGCDMDTEEFYHYALKAVFGELEGDIYDVMSNMLTIHESQINIFQQEFPFARNKMEKRDIPTLRHSIEIYPELIGKIDRVIEAVEKDPHIRAFRQHFVKWKVSIQRCRLICEMGLVSLELKDAQSDEERRRILLKLDELNEKEFDIIKQNYFDVHYVAETGVKSCMIPYHELKREIWNRLDPEHADNEHVYLGVEALGWLWA